MLKPHWIPESTEKGVKTPDMYYTKAGIKIPVEVKTIDVPKIESENLRGKTGSLQPERNTREISFCGIAKKLDDSFESSAKKFDLFNRISASRGELWLYYLASCDVILETNGRSSTVKRIDDYTSVHVPKNISYRIFDLLSITGWQETQ